jgi:hypothetical protein
MEPAAAATARADIVVRNLLINIHTPVIDRVLATGFGAGSVLPKRESPGDPRIAVSSSGRCEVREV